ncbi:MAG TPA: class I SAM-dependent methyltransferase, partial [Candidatus Binataceae bacterium]|nr:class I SAM-dependent methyltransferase [Candidatus Binataceae bacterium]
PRSIRGLEGAPEWPAIQALLPSFDGKRVVDLGCGFGWFARWARERGAARVTGVDLSQRMIQRAKAATHDSAIEYIVADLEHIELAAESFDFAYRSLVFHYIVDLKRLLTMVDRALVPGSILVFTTEHPIYMAPAHPRWLIDDNGNKIWPLNRYSVEGARTTDWLAKGVVKQHRTIGTTLCTLIGAGFTIRHVQEWAPTAEQVANDPELAEELERPTFLLVSAQR